GPTTLTASSTPYVPPTCRADRPTLALARPTRAPGAPQARPALAPRWGRCACQATSAVAAPYHLPAAAEVCVQRDRGCRTSRTPRCGQPAATRLSGAATPRVVGDLAEWPHEG